MYSYMTLERVIVIKTVKNIHKFNNELKSIKDRSDYVSGIIEDNIDVIENHNKAGSESDLRKQKMLERNLEKLGTYLLRSSDVDGSRSLEDYPFYRDNYELYGQTITNSENEKIQRTVPIDPQENAFIFDENNSDNDIHLDKWRLFDFSSMKQDHKMYFLKNCLVSMSDSDNQFQEEYKESYEYILSLTKDDRDRTILDLTIEGWKQEDIAEKISISQQAVAKRLSRIVKDM